MLAPDHESALLLVCLLLVAVGIWIAAWRGKGR